jgi:Na+/H+ antiporter NhaD/arsenite permease-like protein
MKQNIIDFLIREWLFLLSFIGFIITSYSLSSLPKYTQQDLTPIIFLFALFVVVKGMERSGFLSKIASFLEKTKFLPQKLLLLSFILSGIITIDVALVALLPIVLSLNLNIKERDKLVILVAFAAHIGAALTPFGTPQNLFIYSYYNVNPLTFIQTIAPFSFIMLAIFFVFSFLIKHVPKISSQTKVQNVNTPMASIFLLLFTAIVLVILHILPMKILFIVLLFLFFFDLKSFKIDYFLLFTFVLFIGLTTNIKILYAGNIEHPTHIFLLSSFLSQFISNVPTTLLLNKFTTQWEALLWGTNVGGFGSIVAALANLITYKIYLAHSNGKNIKHFLFKLIVYGYITFFTGYAIYFLLFTFWK